MEQMTEMQNIGSIVWYFNRQVIIDQMHNLF